MRSVLFGLTFTFFLSLPGLVAGLAEPNAAPSALLEKIDTSLLPSADQLYNWHAEKDSHGGTFSGSPSWKRHVDVLEAGLRANGLIDITKDHFSYRRWYTSDNPKDGNWTLSIGGQNLPVASYWAYSGETPEEGVTAPLVWYDEDEPPTSIEGKIVVFEIPPIAGPFAEMFAEPGYEFATDPESYGDEKFSSEQWFQGNYVTRFGKFDQVVKAGKAAGALVIFDMGAERAAGLYTFPLLSRGKSGVPGLYLDRHSGAVVKQAALSGGEATLTLLAQEEQAGAYFLTGFLPGKNYGTPEDEYLFLITHTDGPNLTQENGGFAILSIVGYFNNVPQARRDKTILVMLDPEHYKPERHSVDWYALHPEFAEKIVVSVGVEHLGQREFVENGDRFLPSGQAEPAFFFVQDNQTLIDMVVKATKDHALPRTRVQSPPRGGQGNWSGMSDIAVKRHIPGVGFSTNMSAYWSTQAKLNSFDADLCAKQIAAVTQVVAGLMVTPVAELVLPPRTGAPGRPR